jgi:predicted Zn-dependent protease
MRALALLAAAFTLDAQPQTKWAAIGNALAADYRQSHPTFSCPEAEQVLERLAPKITPLLGGGNYTYAIVTHDNRHRIPEPIAFAGGHLFVPAAVFERAASEEEFAAAIAHALAHLHLSHYRTESPGAIPLYWNPAAEILPLAVHARLPQWEREADEAARAALAAAGLDPYAIDRYGARSQQLSTPKWREVQDAVRAAAAVTRRRNLYSPSLQRHGQN